MTMEVMTIDISGHRLGLVSGGGVWLEDARALLVADVHLGKAETFASLGVPVPAMATDATLAKLSLLIDAMNATSLIVLGDWLHGPRALDQAVLTRLAAWRTRHAETRITIVGGNHDASAGAMPASLDILSVEEPLAAPNRSGLWLAHHHTGVDAGDPETGKPKPYLLAGHLHPALRLRSRAGDALRLPCWWFGSSTGVLPAFGEFTGGHSIKRVAGDRVFVTVGDAVREIPPTVRQSALPK